MTTERVGALTEVLHAVVYFAPEPLAAAVLEAGLVPFPNAMGLVSPSRAAAPAPRSDPGRTAAGA